MIILRSV